MEKNILNENVTLIVGGTAEELKQGREQLDTVIEEQAAEPNGVMNIMAKKVTKKPRSATGYRFKTRGLEKFMIITISD